MRTPFIVTILGLPALVAGLAMNTAVEHLHDQDSLWLAGSIIVALLAVDTFLLTFVFLLRRAASTPTPTSPAGAGDTPAERRIEDSQDRQEVAA